MTDLAALQARLDKTRASSKVSGEYWKVVDRDGKTRFVFLDPPGDLKRLRAHYPGADGVVLRKEDWMREVEEAYGGADGLRR